MSKIPPQSLVKQNPSSQNHLLCQIPKFHIPSSLDQPYRDHFKQQCHRWRNLEKKIFTDNSSQQDKLGFNVPSCQ